MRSQLTASRLARTLVVALLLGHAPALAQDAPSTQPTPAPQAPASQSAPAAEPSADVRARAAAHFRRGLQRASEQAYAEALAEFEAAYALVRHSATLYNIALAQVGLGRTGAAVATLRTYLAEPAATQHDAQRAAARALLDQQLVKLAETPAAQSLLTIVVFPYGQVWINGEPAGSSPLTRRLPPGPHRISGGREQPELSTDVTLEPGATQRVVLPWARADLVPTTR